MDGYKKVTNRQRDLRRREEVCSHKAVGVDSGPSQNA